MTYAVDSEAFAERVAAVLARCKSVDPKTGCWLWTGYRMRDGHGQVTVFRKNHLVHRLSAFLHLGLSLERRPVGSRRDRSQVNHKCSNAHCFNPEHIYIGTQGENRRDVPPEKQPRVRVSFPYTCRNGHTVVADAYVKDVGCLECKRRRGRKEYDPERRERLNVAQREKRRRGRDIAA